MQFSEAEWKLMTALWAKSPASARDVLDVVAPETDWAYTTVKTMLDRLVEKGALRAETPRNTALYTPLVSRTEGRRSAVRNLLDQAFGGAFAPLVAHLLDDERLSKRDRDELARMLKEREASAGGGDARAAPEGAHAVSFAEVVAHLASGTALLAVAAVVDALLRRRGGHRLRGAVWAAATLKLVVPASVFAGFGPSLSSPAAPFDPPTVAHGADVGPTFDVAGLAFATWIVGVAASLAVVVARTLAFRRRVAGGAVAVPPELAVRASELARRAGLRFVPRLVPTSGVAGPCAFGLVRPRVALPPVLAYDGSAALDHVLLHEFAHVRRGDLPLAALLTVLRAVYWFHPLVALLARRVAELRELGCDAAAARAAEDGGDAYRATLLDAAARRFDLARPAAFAAWTGPTASIVVRLRHLERLGRGGDRAVRGVAPLVAALAFACAPVVLPAAAPAPSSAADGSVEAARDAEARRILDHYAAGGRESCFDVRMAAIRAAGAAAAPELADAAR